MTATQFTVITVLIVTIIVMTGLNLWLAKAEYEINYSPRVLILLLLMPLIRLLFPFEFPFTYIIKSGEIYPALFYPLIQPFFTIGEFSVTGMTLLTFVWIGGFLGFALHNCYCYFKIKNCFKNEAYCSNEKINSIVAQCLEEEEKTVPVICTAFVSEPMLMGGINPTIILPNQPFAEDELYYILAHEVCHYKNKDLLIKYFAGLLSCVFWWIPQVHLLKRQLDCVLELRADREVLNQSATQQKAAYLHTLLKIQTNKSRDMRLPIGSAAFTFGNKRVISKRFHAITNMHPASYRQKVKECIITAVLGVVLLLPFAVVLQPLDDRSNAEEGTYTVENGEAYVIQRDNLYDFYINHEFVTTWTEPEYNGDRLEIPIKK